MAPVYIYIVIDTDILISSFKMFGEGFDVLETLTKSTMVPHEWHFLLILYLSPFR